MEEEETVTIPKKEYEELLESQQWLGYLEAAGVDDWEGVSFAYDLSQGDEIYVGGK